MSRGHDPTPKLDAPAHARAHGWGRYRDNQGPELVAPAVGLAGVATMGFVAVMGVTVMPVTSPLMLLNLTLCPLGIHQAHRRQAPYTRKGSRIVARRGLLWRP
jgi:hypothetical protein